MFRGFQELSQLQERQMFSATTAMKKAIIHENVQNLKFMMLTDDQIDSNIIFDDPYVDNNSGQAEYDSNAHDQPYADNESLIYNVQVEAESQRKMNIELNKQKALLQRELEMSHDESLNIKNEIECLKKHFKVREDKYLDDIVTLEDKLKSHERVVFKMSHSLQTMHMIGTKPNSFYDPNMKAGLGYKNSKRLKKAIEAQPKMYN
ncbi:hypothetical protein Tco_0527776 [Tanacetum coccineum]